MKVMKLRYFAAAAVLTGMMAAAAVYHESVANAILLAGQRCVTIIIPSLYLFSILAAFAVRTGLLMTLAKPIDRLSRLLLRMDGTLLLVLLFSQLGGYPVGAQLLHRLRCSGALNEKQEQALLCVCIGCGPAFLLGTVCRGLSVTVTAVLLLSVSLPNLVLACFLGQSGILTRESCPLPSLRLHSTDLTEAVEAGAAAMLKICSMILFFAALYGIAEGCGLLAAVGKLLPCAPTLAEGWLGAVLEISTITDFLQHGGTLPQAAALLSFGGICVHLQNAAICDGKFPWLRFWGCRLLTAVCAWGICTGLLRFLYGGEVPAALLQPFAAAPTAPENPPLPVLCLIVMSVLLLMRHDHLCNRVRNSQKE